MDTHIFKRFREKHGLSQRELGKRLGVTSNSPQGLISHFENGRRDVPIDYAHRFLVLAADYGDHHTLEDVYPIPEDFGPEAA